MNDFDINIASTAPRKSDLSSKAYEIYDPDMFIVHVWGTYYDNEVKTQVNYDEFINYNVKLKLSGPISERDAFMLSSLFKSKKPVKAILTIPGEPLL